MTACATCGHENQPGVQFCDECGLKLPTPSAEETRLLSGADDSRASTPARLEIARGASAGKVFALEASGETLVGRWDPDGGCFPEIDLTGDDPDAKISRKHARIYVRDGAYHLEDLGSLNGTYVNRGPRLLPGSPQTLRNQDEIVMGKTFFRFRMAD